MLTSEWALYLTFACSIGALGWGALQYHLVSKVEMSSGNIKVQTLTDEEKREITAREQEGLGVTQPPQTQEACLTEMLRIADKISTGANEFLRKEYTYLVGFCLLFSAVIYAFVDYPVSPLPSTTLAFWVGALTSMLCGFIGMRIAVYTNVRTTLSCCSSLYEGFHVAFKGGQVLGFCLVGLAVLVLQVLILAYRALLIKEAAQSEEEFTNQVRELFEAVAGYGLGGSLVALFGRVGGGIYTKAADVGADLAGKVCEGLEEDSPENPGTIADNVGDNVGDIAGMGADLFGSLAESTCAALVVSAHSQDLLTTSDAVYFPLIVTAIGIFASFLSQFCARLSIEASFLLLPCAEQFFLALLCEALAVLGLGLTLPLLLRLAAKVLLTAHGDAHQRFLEKLEIHVLARRI